MRHAWSLLLTIACSTFACRTPTRTNPTQTDTLATPTTLTEPAVLRLEFVHRTLGGSTSERLPWIVAFHGLGDTPENFSRLFDNLPIRAHLYLPRAPIAYGAGYDWFGARVSDQDGLTRAIQRSLPLVAELIAHLASESKNTGEAIVTGFSQGGIVSFAVAAADLSHVKVAIPLAGWLPPGLASKPRMKVIAFHGEADPVVPFAATQTLVEAWQSENNTPESLELHSYPALKHSVNGAMKHDWETALRALTKP